MVIGSISDLWLPRFILNLNCHRRWLPNRTAACGFSYFNFCLRHPVNVGGCFFPFGRARWPQRAVWLDGWLGLSPRRIEANPPYHTSSQPCAAVRLFLVLGSWFDLRPPTSDLRPQRPSSIFHPADGLINQAQPMGDGNGSGGVVGIELLVDVAHVGVQVA